ncbi:hypothetical protein WR25_11483 isoform B [Diploscapter pachys]|uniref:Uncharacterized protein n=1 Tax=Diploscapter pachys TaxID=2018661 RepID=A0A2A2JPG3_9BILA|nr:hypothetical protein WR25_11483 isoform A [Diploscapter pachys]PAV63707.1 hypothetical protein WR25_11483 isoform B [Diploscapter pachys]
MILTRGTARYLRNVAMEGRALTYIESYTITAVLRGMAVSQIANFLSMGFRLATKDELTWLDIINFSVATQNLYSCLVSPKTAESMLAKIKRDMADAARENEINTKKKLYQDAEKEAKTTLKNLEKELTRQKEANASESEIKNTESRIAEQKQNIERLQLDFVKTNRLEMIQYEEHLKSCREQIKQAEAEGNREKLAELKKDEALYLKKMKKSTEATEKQQQKFLDDKGEAMKDKDTKKAYSDFVKNTQNCRGENTQIDQNDRIIRAVISMDAEQVFKLVAETKSTVRFATGEDIILHFNEEIRVHPSALKQMHVNPDGTRKDNLREVLECTQKFKNSSDTSPYSEEKYLKDIKKLLSKDYRMISDTEIKAFVKNKLENSLLKSLTTEQQGYFKDLKPEEVYRLRTVISDDKTVNEKFMQAAVKLAEKRGVTDNPREIANCIEIMKMYTDEQVSTYLRV